MLRPDHVVNELIAHFQASSNLTFPLGSWTLIRLPKFVSSFLLNSIPFVFLHTERDSK